MSGRSRRSTGSTAALLHWLRCVIAGISTHSNLQSGLFTHGIIPIDCALGVSVI